MALRRSTTVARALISSLSPIAPARAHGIKSRNAPKLPSILRNQYSIRCYHVTSNTMALPQRERVFQADEHSDKSSPISPLLNDSELDDVVELLSSGPGYVVLPSIFSQGDAENAYNIILEEMSSNKNDVRTSYSDIRQNHYGGILYGLLSQISNRILGDKSRLSSLSSNTVYKGMKGQNPQTDYPYHPHLWPQGEGKNFATPQLMSLTFITALSDLTPENGTTALVPGSQRNTEFPDDIAEFEKKAVQITANRGDLCIIAGSIQHCSRPNKTEIPRCAILQQMVSLFVNPFEDFRDFENCVPKDDKVWQKLLAMDHPLPKNQFNKNTRFQF